MSQETPQEKIDKDDTPLPFWMILLFPLPAAIIFGLILFPIARWDWTWLEAWLFIGANSLNIVSCYLVINKKNPRVIRNRTKFKKTGITDKTKKSAGSDFFIMPLMLIGFLGAMLIPAFEYRLNFPLLPQIHIIGEIIGLAIMNTGFAIMNIAQLQNSYASKILDINKGQKLVDTGMYAHVRHPLYTGASIMALGMPVALGSLIAVLPAIIVVVALIFRIKFEEEMLIKGMEGYEEYRQRVKYKLFPGIY